jgi:molybdate transport repressor ModE-like protein
VLGQKVLNTTRGGMIRGGARLTPAARRLVKLFESWRHASIRSSDAAFERLLRR